MPNRKDPPSPLGHLQYLNNCFGRNDEEARAKCPCPDSCKKLCAEAGFDERRSPRVDKGAEPQRAFTPFPQGVTRHWGEHEPGPRTKNVYLDLLSYSRPASRWVLQSTRELAAGLGMTEGRYLSHVRLLGGLALIRRVRMSEVSARDRSHRHVIMLLDLPDWMPGVQLKAKAETEATSKAPEPLGEDDSSEDLDLSEYSDELKLVALRAEASVYFPPGWDEHEDASVDELFERLEKLEHIQAAHFRELVVQHGLERSGTAEVVE